MVPDFSKFFAKILLSTPQKTKPRLSSDSQGQKLYVHKDDNSVYVTSRAPALFFQNFNFWSSIAANSVYILTLK